MSRHKPVLGAIVFFGLVSAFLLWRPGQPEAAVRIGIVQMVAHPLLDEVKSGFLEEMAVHGYEEGEKASFELHDAHNELGSAYSIVRHLVNTDVDLIFALSTPAAQAAARGTREARLPMVFAVVTDPRAAGLVENFDRPGGHITGVTGNLPLDRQLDLFTRLYPQLKTLGMVHNPSESNSRSMVDRTREACQRHGLGLEVAPVASSGEIYTAARALSSKVDAFFNGADNTVQSGLASLIRASGETGTPLFASDVGTVERGAVATIGRDWVEEGRAAARLAVRILDGEDPGQLAITELVPDLLAFNVEAAERFGIAVPRELIQQADFVFEAGATTASQTAAAR